VLNDAPVHAASPGIFKQNQTRLVNLAERPGSIRRIQFLSGDMNSTRNWKEPSRTSDHSGCFYESVRVRIVLSGLTGKAAMSLKSYLCTLAIFCGGYVFNTLLDSAVEAAQAYFRLHTSTYKTDSSDYIICSREKPNDNLMPLTLNAWGE
jgi:hypothetical protein